MTRQTIGLWALLLPLAMQAQTQNLYTDSVKQPIQWSHAEAVHNNGSNIIKWTTAYESNAKEYLVEKSTNGTTWESMAAPIAANNLIGPNYYQVNDPLVTSPATWYRIRRTDNDGKTAYSVILIAQKGKGIMVQLYPYPSEGEYTISAGQTLRTVQVFNAADSLMYVTIMNGISYHTINSKNFVKGKYYVLLELADGNLVKEYFVKQ